MGGLPGYLLRHTVTVEPHLGAGADGPRYGPAVTVRCFVDEARKKVRDSVGKEVVSEATVICPLSTDAPVESRVTVAGRAAYVIASKRRDGGGLPTPDHLELALT